MSHISSHKIDIYTHLYTDRTIYICIMSLLLLYSTIPHCCSLNSGGLRKRGSDSSISERADSNVRVHNTRSEGGARPDSQRYARSPSRRVHRAASSSSCSLFRKRSAGMKSRR